MDETTVTAPAEIDDASTATTTADTDSELIDDELLVEEISIDGMCGVY
ncbi:MAG: mycofactocin precursor [Actinobacteria bacterium]|jgi:mycofactocin precursor|nr:mycofactocin precursor [Actinomycetota bacterium]